MSSNHECGARCWPLCLRGERASSPTALKWRRHRTGKWFSALEPWSLKKSWLLFPEDWAHHHISLDDTWRCCISSCLHYDDGECWWLLLWQKRFSRLQTWQGLGRGSRKSVTIFECHTRTLAILQGKQHLPRGEPRLCLTCPIAMEVVLHLVCRVTSLPNVKEELKMCQGSEPVIQRAIILLHGHTLVTCSDDFSNAGVHKGPEKASEKATKRSSEPKRHKWGHVFWFVSCEAHV